MLNFVWNSIKSYSVKEIVILVGSITIFIIVSCYLYSFFRLGDDTYIYLQYVRNIFENGEISFNSGQKSYGFTSPAWLFLITIFHLIITNLEIIPQLLSISFSILTIVVWFKIVSTHLSKINAISFLLLVIIALDPNLLKHSYLGMEATLSFFLSTLIAYYILNYKQRKENSKLALISGAYLLVRPESIVVYLILIIWLMLVHDLRIRAIIKMMLLSFLIVLPWLIFSYSYFGTIIPNTLGAKGFDYKLGANFITNVFDSLKIIGGYYLFIPLSTLILLPQLIRSQFFRKKLSIVLLVVSLLVVLIVFYSLTLSNEIVYARYYCMIFPFFHLYFLLLLKNIYELSLKYKSVIIFSFIYIVILSVVMSNLTIMLYREEIVEDKIIQWVNDKTEKDDLIVTLRIGKIGYNTRRKILDPIGLINPEISEYYNNNRIEEYYMDKRPDYFIGTFNIKKIKKRAKLKLVKKFYSDVNILPRQMILGNLPERETIPIYKATWD